MALVLEAARSLDLIMRNLPTDQSQVDHVLQLERQCDTLLHQIVDLLRRSFITPFERDEIRHLISAMDDIVDFIEGTANRSLLFEIQEVPDEIIQTCTVLIQAIEQVSIIIKKLRNVKKDHSFDFHFKEIHRLENEGDRFHRTGLAELFKNEKDPIMVIKIKEINEKMEQAIDRCEDVANLVEGITIEHQG